MRAPNRCNSIPVQPQPLQIVHSDERLALHHLDLAVGQFEGGEERQVFEGGGAQGLDGVSIQRESHEGPVVGERVRGHSGELVLGQVQLDEVGEAVKGAAVDARDLVAHQKDLLQVDEVQLVEPLGFEVREAVAGKVEHLSAHVQSGGQVLQLTVAALGRLLAVLPLADAHLRGTGISRPIDDTNQQEEEDWQKVAMHRWSVLLLALTQL